MWILNNECSSDLKRAFTNEDITWQHVPPHQHRANAAERAIRTAKAHIKAVLASIDPAFPVHEWDRLIPQMEIT